MRLQIARHHNGVGDWAMVLAALRWLRKQHPDVDLIIDFRNAPHIVQEAFAASDLIFQDARTCTDRPDVSIGHLVYPLRGVEPYMTGIARMVSEVTGRQVVPDRNDLPFAKIERPASDSRAFSIVGHGKGITRGGKEWGKENFVVLSQLLLELGYELRQVGGARDFPLPGATHCLGGTFAAAAAALMSTHAFIGIENGLMVLAGFLRVPLVTIYDGAAGADRIDFDQHLKIAEHASPRSVLNQITQWLR